jgi:hypothetical protein
MEMDDFSEGPVGVAVAASAVVFSPQVRRTLRRGLVYGVAGVLTAGDVVTGFVRGVRRSTGRRELAGRVEEEPDGDPAGTDSDEIEANRGRESARSRARGRKAARHARGGAA